MRATPSFAVAAFVLVAAGDARRAFRAHDDEEPATL